MKRLKLYCPFHGKYWPLIAALFSLIAVWCSTLKKEWPQEIINALLLFVPLGVLIVCYIIIQRPSAAERDLIAGAEYPCWVPADEKVLRAVKDQKQQLSPGIVRVLLYIGVFALASVLPGGHDSEPSFGLAAFFALLAGIILAADMLLRSRWQSADQSAVMTKVPIDHMFDIVHRYGRRQWEWQFNIERPERTTSYAVFYQPDGRYVLPVNEGAGYAKSLIIVQYNGMLAWVPCAEP